MLATSAVLMAALPGCHLPWQKSGPPPGSIVFGRGIHRVSPYEIVVTREQDTFHRKQSVAWVAYLRHPARTRTLTVTILSASGHVIQQKSVSNINPKWTEIADSGEPVRGFVTLGVKVPGEYTISYAHRSAVLAEGTFRLRR